MKKIVLLCASGMSTSMLVKKMQEAAKDDKWTGDNAEIMTLTLEHHMAATRMGFSTFFNPLYTIDKLKTGLLDGTSSSINLFAKIV